MADKQTTISEDLRKRFFAVMGAHGFDTNRRKELIYGWTEGRTDSLTAMTTREVLDLLAYVDRAYVRPLTAEEQAHRDKEKRMRSRLLALATALGLLPKKAIGAQLTEREWQPLNQWLLKKTAFKKPMKELTVFELGKVIDQLEEWKARGLRDNGKGVSDSSHE